MVRNSSAATFFFKGIFQEFELFLVKHPRKAKFFDSTCWEIEVCFLKLFQVVLQGLQYGSILSNNTGGIFFLALIML